MSGPLTGLKVLEMPAIGPVPFCGMLLADLGADVLRLDRTEDSGLGIAIETRYELLGRGKKSLALDIKSDAGRQAVLKLMERADIVLEGFRPGTMERLGLGPEVALARNPRLVYGRMTGWGQEGPHRGSSRPRHQLHRAHRGAACHRRSRRAADAPAQPRGRLRRRHALPCGGRTGRLARAPQSGRGQVVDAAMVDGAASLMTVFYGMLAEGSWHDRRGDNLIDGGAPWYGTFECKDGRHVAVGALEPKFFRELLARIELDPSLAAVQMDRVAWPRIRAALAEALPGEDTRRMGRAAGGHGLLLRAGAVPDRGAIAPAAEGPQHLRGRVRGSAARARAALLAHTGRAALAPARTRRRRHARRGRLGSG